MKRAAKSGAAGQRDGGDALLAVAQRARQAQQDRVAGGGDDRVVELAIGAREAEPVARRLRLLLGGDRDLERGEQVGAAVSAARRTQCSSTSSRASKTSSISAAETGTTSAPRLG